MRTCPKCQQIFNNDTNYCLEDGVHLVSPDSGDPEKTLNLSNKSGLKDFDPNRSSETETLERLGKTNHNKKSNLSKFFIIGGIGLIFLVVSLVGGTLIIQEIIKRMTDDRGITSMTDPPGKPAPPPVEPVELKIEIGDKVKNENGHPHLKLRITNPSDQIVFINTHHIGLSIYKDDLKIKDVGGLFDIRYLRPKQSIPLWIGIYGIKDFSSAKVTKPIMGKPLTSTAEQIFSSIRFTNKKMIRKRNDYKVSAIVESTSRISGLGATVSIIFYNEKDEIIGIKRESLNNLERKEKAKFEASVYKNDLFGKPKDFKIIAVNGQFH